MNIWGSFENQAHWWAKCCSKNYTVNVFAVKFSLSILHCFRETSSLFGERCWYLVTMGSLARWVPSEQLPRHKALLTGRGYLQDTSKLCFGDIPNIRSVLKLSTRIRLCSLIVPHCNAVLAGASKSTTDKLQRVLNAAAHIVSNTPKYDCGLSHLLHDELHCWTFLSGCSTSCAQRSIDVCSTKHHSTWRTAASTLQTLRVGSICGPQAAVSCSYCDTAIRC